MIWLPEQWGEKVNQFYQHIGKIWDLSVCAQKELAHRLVKEPTYQSPVRLVRDGKIIKTISNVPANIGTSTLT